MSRFTLKIKKVFWQRLSFGGIVVGTFFFWLSLTPSLLPRSWLFQGLLSGITVMIGYGMGVGLSAGVRRFTDWEIDSKTKNQIKRYFGIGASVLTLAFLYKAIEWQEEIRALVEMDDNTSFYAIGTIIATAATLYILLIIARLIRYATRWLQRFLDKFIPRTIAYVVGAVVIIMLVILAMTDVLIPGIFEAVNQAYSISDGTTTEGTEQPQSPLRSGSPASVVPWDTLGQKGRNFTGLGPTAEQIASYTGREAMTPTRLYVGLKSAEELNDRVDLALKEIERTNAWDRDVMVVATTTGTGWLDPKGVDPIEYMWHGDTAIIGMQYSYLPSTISIFADQGKSKETASALFSEIYIKWQEMPEQNRPKLVVYGLSLGSYGSEASFSGLNLEEDPIDGTLWAGPTFLNELWREVTENRDEGSPMWQPIVDKGDLVRFTAKDDALFKEGTNPEWDIPRAVYLQHGTDPLAFFSVESFVKEPDWLNEERAPDVSKKIFWMPIVTGWQLAFDLPFAGGVPHGHGHEYALGSYTDSWAAITKPNGWTDKNSDNLSNYLEGLGVY